MAGQRIAVVGEIAIATVCQTERTEDGFRVLASRDILAGAGKVANDLRSAGHQTLLVGVVNTADAIAVKRMTSGFCWLMGCDTPTLRQEFVGLDTDEAIRIDRGEQPVISKQDAARMASQIQQFRPDAICIVNVDDLLLQAICEIGLGNLIEREHVGVEPV